MKILLLTLSLISCAQKAELPESEISEAQEAPGLTEKSLNKSVKSLDHTLEMMNKMIADLDRMNNNLDAIFRAVTDCKSNAECRTLKAEYLLQYQESKNQ